MQRLSQSVAKAIARQARGLLDRKAQVRENTLERATRAKKRGFRARAAPVGAVQKSAEISWPVGASRRGAKVSFEIFTGRSGKVSAENLRMG
jgi:hypothetical protein